MPTSCNTLEKLMMVGCTNVTIYETNLCIFKALKMQRNIYTQLYACGLAILWINYETSRIH
jgi:hypothetical protein